MSKRTDKVSPKKTASAQVRFVALPKSDEVAKATRSDAAQELVDGVISRGSLAIKAYEFMSEGNACHVEELKSAALKLTARLHRLVRYESVKGMQFEFAAHAFKDHHVETTAKVIASEVCDYDPRNVSAFKATDATVRQILESISAGPSVANRPTTMVVTTRAQYHDESSDDKIHLTVHVYINLKSKKCVAFYMVEGKI